MNLIQEPQWVIVDTRTYDVISSGPFCNLVKEGGGHLMTHRTWKLIITERGISPKDI